MGSSMRISGLVAIALAASAVSASAITIDFDYTYDTNGFFTGANSGRQALLNQAAANFTSFTDTLSGITPGGSNSWTAHVFNPANPAATLDITNPTIPAGHVTIYVGGAPLSGATLGEGGPGGYNASGFQSFLDTLQARGQAGALGASGSQTDFGPWGGSISFNNNASWYFSTDITGISSTQNDFLSVATHELAHVLGFGTANSWSNRVSSNTFTGALAESLYGGAVPVDPGTGHWLEGILSKTVGGVTQEVAMDPAIIQGTGKLFTRLDYAAMNDLGWNVPSSLVPEPTSFVLCGISGLMLLRRRRAA